MHTGLTCTIKTYRHQQTPNESESFLEHIFRAYNKISRNQEKKTCCQVSCDKTRISVVCLHQAMHRTHWGSPASTLPAPIQVSSPAQIVYSAPGGARGSPVHGILCQHPSHGHSVLVSSACHQQPAGLPGPETCPYLWDSTRSRCYSSWNKMTDPS